MSDETAATAATAAAAAPDDSSKPTGDEMAVDAKPTEPTEKPAAEENATNEAKEPDVNGADDPAQSATAADGDVEMAGTETAGQGTSAGANGTPAAGEKKPARRKSTGVPEHKSKKLNKKKSKAEIHVDAKPGELYLARMKGHPAWPSIIADDGMLPEAISKSRPVTAPNADGTWRRDDYAPGGKRHNERTFPIMFLYTNEFAWIPNGDLTNITADECKEVTEKNKSKTLLEAYREASKGHTLEHYKSLLDDHANALLEEEAARAEREAEKARKAEKKAKRKSEAAAADDMDVDDDSGETKPKSKKRKKEAASNDDEKTPKTPKIKISLGKASNTAEKGSKKKESAKSGKKKNAAKISGSDDDADTPAEEEKVLTPEEKHKKLNDEIRYCRHKLQRSLLSRDSVPSDEEVKNCEPWLKRLEDYPDLAADIITNTKIHKVLKGILKLPSIPKDEEYNFKKRSHELLIKWNKILSENPQAADGKGDEKKDANGDATVDVKNEKSNEDADKKEDEEKPEEKAEETPEAKPDETEKTTEAGEAAPEKPIADEPKDTKSEASEAPKQEVEPTKPAETVEATA